jgi:hypothetical protein
MKITPNYASYNHCMSNKIQTNRTENPQTPANSLNFTSSFNSYPVMENNGIKIDRIKNSGNGFYDVNLDIAGEKYKFKSYEPDKYSVLYSINCPDTQYDYNESIAKMIDNIKQTQSGFFVKYRNHEYYVPNIYEKIPDIRNDMVAIEHGNAETKDNAVTRKICQKLSQISGQEVTLDNLKTINYLTRPHKGYDNNICQSAYAFHDSVNDMHYMYKAENDSLKIMAPNGYVMTEKLISSFAPQLLCQY